MTELARYQRVPLSARFVCEYPSRAACGENTHCRAPATYQIISGTGAPFLCEQHYALRNVTVEEPSVVPPVIGAVYAAQALPHMRLSDYFGTYLNMSLMSLSRLRGDWKRTLAGKVIQLIRRSGILEEQEIPKLGWTIVIGAILKAARTGESVATVVGRTRRTR